jgi:hypothetical protein
MSRAAGAKLGPCAWTCCGAKLNLLVDVKKWFLFVSLSLAER